MENLNAPQLALTILSASQVPGFFSAFLPALHSLAEYEPQETEKTLYWIRRGEINAIAISLAFGAGTSVIAKSALPLIGCIAMTAVMMWNYENALKECAEGTTRDDT